MSTPAAAQPFLGTWRLLPDASRYESGPPPREGRYRLEPAGDTALRFQVDYVDAAGEAKQLTFTVAFSAPDAEGVGMCLVDARTLDTHVRQGGQVLAHARRTLSEDGQRMTVTQSGPAPGGGTFANVSVYARDSEG